MTKPSATPLMPAAFIGHGSPMNALAVNRYTSAWRTFGQSVPWPRASSAFAGAPSPDTYGACDLPMITLPQLSQ